MQNAYRTLKGDGEETIIIKKSRFIGYAKPAETEGQAQAFVESIRKKHWDANHNCYAYQIGEHDEIQKSNDDGEPAGTAGRPILEVIKNAGLKNVVVVVTRYFGGTLLGAGGLIRAYGQSASAAIAAAGVVVRALYQEVAIGLDYTWLGKVENEILNANAGFLIDHIEYADRVTVYALVPIAATDDFYKLITNATNGQAEITSGETRYASIDSKDE